MRDGLTTDDHAQLVAALVDWGRASRRDLPWRRTRDPWAVLVSELMLQQTQVARVVRRYLAFLDRLPTPAACAAATPGEVIALWDGLGYNRRAVNLHAAAARIVADHGGELPGDLDALLALPGVGPYTARAVLAFAFERDHGVVDTNAARVLARAVAGRGLARAEAQAWADALVSDGQAWAWNQAVLDLGATVCLRRRPRCDDCPLCGTCVWRAAGRPVPDPADDTAGTSRPHTAFDGSDRQGRGRIVAALRQGPVPHDRVAEVAGWPEQPDRARRVAAALADEGLARVDGAILTLPH